MNFIEWSLTILFVLALAFTVYYQIIIRALHIDLKAREIHSILTPDGWRIRLFRYRKGGTSGEPVLLVHGYTANHWNLTLPHGESVADFLAERGYDCWVIDLRGNRTSLPPAGTPRHRATYDGYVMQDLPAAIAFIRQSTGYDQVHWVGHSMGGMLLYAYELAHGRDWIASGATMASPPWLETYWTRTQDRLVWFMETLPWVFEVGKRAVAPIFAWLKPHYSLVPIQWNNLNPRFGVKEFFNAAEQSSGPVTRTFEECAKHRYLAVDNDRVNVLQGLNRLQTPLLVMACPLDPIAPPSNLRLFFDRLPSYDKRFVELSRDAGCERDYSHVDPPFARNAAKEVFAPIAEWFAAHPAARMSAQPGAAIAVSAVAHGAMQTPPIAAHARPVEEIPAPKPAAESAEMAPRHDEPSSWGKALESAASILSGLEAPATELTTTGNGSSHRRAPVRKFGRGKPDSKKSTAKETAPRKAKQAASKSASSPGKPALKAESPTKARTGRAPKAASVINRGEPAHDKPRRRSTKAKAARKRPTKERG